MKQQSIGHSAQKVKELWLEARRCAPCVLFLDECEALFTSRGHEESDTFAKEIVTSFLGEWGNLEKNSRIWVIGATNRRDVIDPAALSRFGGFEMLISSPDGANRSKILQRELSLVGVSCSIPIEMQTLTQGMSGRDLQQLAKRARTLSSPNPVSPKELIEAATQLLTRLFSIDFPE